MRRFLLAGALLGALLVGSGVGPGRAAQEPAAGAPDAALGAATPAAEEPPLAPLLRSVQERVEELDRRERELAERDRALDELSGEARRVLDELTELHDAVEARIVAFETLRGDGIGKLAKVYAAMPPAQAAALLDRLDTEVATALIVRMKDRKSAAVLAAMSSERALRVTRSTALPVVEQAASVTERVR